MEYASAGEYLADGKEHDLVFLDIEMGGSGAELDSMGLAGQSGRLYRRKNSGRKNLWSSMQEREGPYKP